MLPPSPVRGSDDVLFVVVLEVLVDVVVVVDEDSTLDAVTEVVAEEVDWP